MRIIDMESWPRRKHFDRYRTMGYPHFSLCANVDLTAFYPAVKQREASLSIAIMYLIARSANAIPEFRYRIHGEQAVEHAVVHPSTTIQTGDELFSFLTVPYTADFCTFAARAAQEVAAVREKLVLHDGPGQDNLLFMTSIPWVSFTAFMHPIPLDPADSVPRFAWGKFFPQGERLLMPLSVQGHHAVMDGIHLGKFYAKIEESLSHPDALLGDA